MVPEQWAPVLRKDHARTHPGKVGAGFPIRIMRKEKAKKSRPWWGRGRGSRSRTGGGGRNEDSEQTSETAARQGVWGGRGVSALTGTGTEVGAKTNDGRE